MRSNPPKTRMMKMLTTKLVYLLLILVIIVVIFLIWQMTAYKAPEPSYSLLKKEGSIEIRRYSSLIIAQVNVKGERKSAIQTGFKILANYIFGNNGTHQKIGMTAPVMQESLHQYTQIDNPSKAKDAWAIRFVIPSLYSIDTLPKPTNEAIEIVRVPNKKYAVIRFRGSSQRSNLDEHEAILHAYLAKHHLKVIGETIYAFYNPPWILPFLRRNEIMLEIE